MRVQVRDQGGAVSLQVCGRLAGCWVLELEECWRTLQAGCPPKRLAVDLRGVTFIDTAGERLLQSMHRQGAKLLAAGLLNQEIIDQITGSSK